MNNLMFFDANIISADKHFDHFDFLSRIDPQKLASKLK